MVHAAGQQFRLRGAIEHLLRQNALAVSAVMHSWRGAVAGGSGAMCVARVSDSAITICETTALAWFSPMVARRARREHVLRRIIAAWPMHPDCLEPQ